jgi:pyruvyltransferase
MAGRPEVQIYYWRGVPNFGDRLAMPLLARFSDVEAKWSPVGEAQLTATGSVLEHIPVGWGGCVIGSGKLREGSRLHLERAEIMAVRGPLTARSIGRPDCVIGDPALLADELVMVRTRDIRLGLVPHWSDVLLARRPEFQRYHPVVINVRDDPLAVVRLIGRCQKVVTSSLHGLIVADAFGIPRRFELAARCDSEGGLFKFRDYSASIGMPFRIGETQQANRCVVEDRKSELFDVFAEFGKLYHASREKITLLVPFRADNPYRATIWLWLERYWQRELPEAELIVCTDDGKPFSKTAALNRGFEKAKGDIVVLLDADCYIRGQVIRDCVSKIRSSRRRGIPLWFVPYRRLYRLGEAASKRLIASDPANPITFPDPPAANDVEHPETAMSGHWWGALIQIMPREAFARGGGMDERFRGWGSEDVSFMHAVDTLYGKHKTSNNPVYHIWHPTITEADKKFRRLWEYQQTAGSNDFLANRYRTARGDAEAMQKVIGRPALEHGFVMQVRLPGVTNQPASSSAGSPAAPAD